jgi:glycosyltransferase involved in cell wall biosynthesis
VNISILHYAAPPIVGGVESTIYHHARLLSSAGYQVSIIAGRGSTFDKQIPFRLIPEIDSRHPRVIEIGQQLSKGTIPGDFYTLRDELVSNLLRELKKTDKLIVHNAITLHKNLALTAALKIISEQEKPDFLAWCHDFAWQDQLYTPELHPGYPWDLLKTAWESVDYIAVSDHRRQRLANLLGITPANIRVISPGVDINQFLGISQLGQEFIDRSQILNSDPIILLPARITRRKNLEFAFRVTALLKINHPHVALIITGPPGPHNPKNIEYLDSLIELRSSLGIKSNIHFIYQMQSEGEIFSAPDHFIAELYRISDMVIFPSLREGFGIPVLEAGLGKTPIFASNIPPVRESSAGMIDLFDPTKDPAQAAEMIETFMQTNRAYQLRRQVLNHYTWQSIVNNQIIPLLAGIGDEAHG